MKIKKHFYSAMILFFSSAALFAQNTWPTKAIKIIVPYPAGGPVDQLARTIAPKLGEVLGQAIILDNKAGASGTIGLDAAIRADPDGYTFGFGIPGAIAVLPHLQKVPYNVDEINYVSVVAKVPQVIAVSSKKGLSTLAEAIALAKKEPSKLNYASAGNVTTPHLGSELLSQEAGIKMTHVAYKGAAPAVTALLAGEVDLISADLPAVLQFEGKGIKILAVSTLKRIDSLPAVPTTLELGYPGVYVESYYGLIAPTALPAAINQKMRDALFTTLNNAAIKHQIVTQGAFAYPSSGDEYKKLMQQESIKWAQVLKRGQITLE